MKVNSAVKEDNIHKTTAHTHTYAGVPECAALHILACMYVQIPRTHWPSGRQDPDQMLAISPSFSVAPISLTSVYTSGKSWDIGPLTTTPLHSQI